MGTVAVFAFVFLSVARFLDPEGALAHYGVWYVVTFAWIGLWHRLLERGRALGTGITVSAGVARHVAGTSPAETVARADACLYAAKEAGRDRIIVADDVASDTPPSPVTRPESVDGTRSP